MVRKHFVVVVVVPKWFPGLLKHYHLQAFFMAEQNSLERRQSYSLGLERAVSHTWVRNFSVCVTCHWGSAMEEAPSRSEEYVTQAFVPVNQLCFCSLQRVMCRTLYNSRVNLAVVKRQ